jgi:hypothetical protein
MAQNAESIVPMEQLCIGSDIPLFAGPSLLHQLLYLNDISEPND